MLIPHAVFADTNAGIQIKWWSTAFQSDKPPKFKPLLDAREHDDPVKAIDEYYDNFDPELDHDDPLKKLEDLMNPEDKLWTIIDTLEYGRIR